MVEFTSRADMHIRLSMITFFGLRINILSLSLYLQETDEISRFCSLSVFCPS